VLDLSKVEAGKMEIFVESFDVAAIANEVAQTLMPVCRKHNTTLTVDCASDVGVMRGDVTKVRQVLFNLVSNAGKFTEKGSVTLSVARTLTHTGDNGGARARIVFRIVDTGIGMSPAEVERVFQPFVQADASTTRRFGGTGLGLSISKHFAELMQGHITVESVSGAGSTFTFTLPAEPAEED